MSKYVCQICGYVYDEAKEKVPFDELPNDWVCPLCGAEKSMLEKQEEKSAEPIKQDNRPTSVHSQEESDDSLREMSAGELSALCSNLARGCEKQYKSEESDLFTKLAEYYASKVTTSASVDFSAIATGIEIESKEQFPTAKATASEVADRGAARVLVWSEKVTKIIQSLLSRYEKEGNKMLEGTKVWVCDICGFIYVGDVPPAVCPVCKVPNMKILEVK